MALVVGTCTKSHARSLVELKPCPIPDIHKVEERQLVGAGFDLLAMKYWRTFDLDGNKVADYHVEYGISGIREDKTLILSTFPSTYYYDADGDGFYEVVMMDVNGNGVCKDLRPYTGRQHEQSR
ncbi:MAG: hypothetical protein KGI54_18770 [Pseudomonadota bacterium]|nr:hypothetical protein [Pseudomonadota bacterium]